MQQEHLVVFAPVGGIGPIDFVTLDLNTGVYQPYDVKSFNERKQKFRVTADKLGTLKSPILNTKIYRPVTKLQKKLKVKLIYVDARNNK